MSAIARRSLFRATRASLRTSAPRRSYADNPSGKMADFTGDPAGAKKVDLKEGARRDPELYVRPTPPPPP